MTPYLKKQLYLNDRVALCCPKNNTNIIANVLDPAGIPRKYTVASFKMSLEVEEINLWFGRPS